MSDAIMISFVIVSFLVLLWILFRNSEMFVGSGFSGAAKSYNSGADLREQSLSENLYGDYLKLFEKNEGEMIRRRSMLGRTSDLERL